MAWPRSPLASLSAVSHLLLLLLLLLCQLCDVTRAQRCPQECSCIGTFVSCYQFTEDSLDNLPTNPDTLILHGGKIRSFPQGFAKRFPQLTLLEIQSTQVETIAKGTFSGVSGLDQLAVTDCQLGSIEAGAFQDISAVSQVLISGSSIGTVRTGAFSALSDMGEFSIWSTQIDKVEQGAFTGLSDFSSFTFYLNNVTVLAKDAFVDVKHFGKVDIYLNVFTSIHGSAVIPLTTATSDVNMYSNTFPCECGIVQAFHRPPLSRFLLSQKCTTRDAARVVRLSEVDGSRVCANQPTTLPTSTPLTDRTASLTNRDRNPTSVTPTTAKADPVTSKPTALPRSSQSMETATDWNLRPSSTRSHGTGSETGTAASVSQAPAATSTRPLTLSDVTSTRAASTGASRSGTGQSDGRSDGSFQSRNGAYAVGTQSSFVFLLGTVVAVWLVSVI